MSLIICHKTYNKPKSRENINKHVCFDEISLSFYWAIECFIYGKTHKHWHVYLKFVITLESDCDISNNLVNKIVKTTDKFQFYVNPMIFCYFLH